MTDTAAIVQTLLHQVAGYARAHPTDARAQSDVGGTLLRMGQPAEAIPFLLAAVRLAPDNLQVLGWRARAYFEVGEWERAAVDCERASSAPKSPASFHRLLGMIRLAQGRLPDARASWQRATEREPANPDLFFELAAVEQALADPRSAQQAFERCAKLAPELAAARRDALSRITPGTSPQAVLALVRNTPGAGPASSSW